MTIIGPAFTMLPTNELESLVETLTATGLEVIWRPDTDTAVLAANGRACVMVEDDAAERRLGGLVRSVRSGQPPVMIWRSDSRCPA